MHEIGLLKNALAKVKQEAVKKGLTEVERVDLVIGKMQGVIAETLNQGLEMIRSEEPMFANCQLKIKEVEGSMECRGCGCQFSLDKLAESCPACGGTDVKLVSGLEFLVESYTGK